MRRSPARQAFDGLSAYEQDSIVEFLKTLQVLPPGSKDLIVDERGRPKVWPPRGRPSESTEGAPNTLAPRDR